MENLLQGIPGVCIYIDDILITGHTEEEHLEHLTEVLTRLSKAGLTLKKAKCSFFLDSVEYLGHIISKDELHTSESKVKAVLEAPSPKNVPELRSFLGIVNYYGKFLPDLASALAPLYALLQKKKKWKWGSKQQQAFNHVKNLLNASRVRVHFEQVTVGSVVLKKKRNNIALVSLSCSLYQYMQYNFVSEPNNRYSAW